MARVSRTTGFFLVLGVIVLLGTGVGAYFLSMPNSVSDVTDDTSTTYDVFCRGPVDVPSGVSTPVPGVPTGVIAFVYVKEGDFVKAGDPLYRLDDRSAKLKVEEAELAVLTAREQNELAKLSAEEYKARIKGQETKVTIAKLSWEQANKAYLKKKDVQPKIGSPIEEVEILEKDVFKTNAAHLLEEFLLNEMKRLAPNQHTLELADLKCREADLALKAAKQLFDRHVANAPRDGYVTEINDNLSLGGPFPPIVNALQPRPPIVFAPDEPLIVRAQVPQGKARLVKPGMNVTLRDHDPSIDKTWSGKVESLSRWVQRPRSVLMEPDQMNDAKVRECIIRVDGKPDDLPIGSMMRVQIEVKNEANR